MTAPVNTTLYMRPDRNLALELVRVTEAGAMAAGRWVGRGDKEAGDGAAVDAMRQLVASVSMRGVVVIGEGEKDEAPMLYNGEEVGNGLGPDCDFAVDPVDGTTLMAMGMRAAGDVLPKPITRDGKDEHPLKCRQCYRTSCLQQLARRSTVPGETGTKTYETPCVPKRDCASRRAKQA